MSSTIKVIRGDDHTISINLKDWDGVAVDLTGATVYFTVRKESTVWDATDDTALIEIDQTSHVDASAWLTNIVLTNTDTDIAVLDYCYDLQIKFTNWIINSIESGIFSIIQDVTKRS